MATTVFSCACSSVPGGSLQVGFPDRIRSIQRTGTFLSHRGSISTKCSQNSAVFASAPTNPILEDQIRLQDFLEEAQGLGKVHLYINTHTEELKTRTSMEHLRYDDSDEDAWDACLEHDDEQANVKLYIRRVQSGVFKEDFVMGVPLYIIQFLAVSGFIIFSLTLMAEPKTQEYEPQQIETYQALLKKYGPTVRFSNQINY